MAKKKTMEQPLLNNSKNVIRRVVVAIRGSHNELKKQTQVVLSLESHLQKMLDDRINNLNRFCFAVIPRIKVDIVPNPVEGYTKENLRIVVSTTTKDVFPLTDKDYEANRISHVVEIDFTDETSVSERQNINAVYQANSIEVVQSMIVDFMADIAMYHSWEIKPNEEDLTFRRKISQEKLMFAKKNNLIGVKGVNKLWNGNPGYFSLAFACHAKEGFDYAKYEEVWKQFVRPHIVKEQVVNKTIEEQVKFFAEVGQMSMRKVQKLYNEYPEAGPYILMMMRQRPRRNEDARHVVEYFGKKKWKNGTIKIVPMSRYEEVARFYPAVSMYKIVRN